MPYGSHCTVLGVGEETGKKRLLLLAKKSEKVRTWALDKPYGLFLKVGHLTWP